MSKKTLFILLFLFLLVFRTFFGLSKTFYGSVESERDALQTYNIGLKYYTTGTWPYFGPDRWNMDSDQHFQIFGALEGLVVGLPFTALPIPEAPFLFLNLLSLSVLTLMAWYATRRCERLKFLWALAWVALLPWTMNQSTHVFNISFLLIGSIIFFLGFFESVPELSQGWLKEEWVFAFMSFGLFWDMQFHQSWVLLPPFVAGAFLWRRWKGMGNWMREGLGFVGGSLLPLALLVPTILAYPQYHLLGGIAQKQGFYPDHLKNFLTILARYLSFACFEIPRFLGLWTSERLKFMKEVPWVIPPALLLVLVGWVQPFVLLLFPLFKPGKSMSMKMIWLWVMAGFLLVYVSFLFADLDPAAHMYYILLPLPLYFSLLVWDKLMVYRWVVRLGLACLVASLWFHACLAIAHIQGDSIYQDRGRVVRALEQKDYRILSERRPGSWY